MDMSFGKYKDKAVAWVMLEHIDYFLWMRSKDLTDRTEYVFFKKLAQIFDDKPFSEVQCDGSCKGANPVTRLSLYSGQFNYLEYWWCNDCNPYESGAVASKLSTVSSLYEISSLNNKKDVVKVFARAKGVPKRKTKIALQQYFDYSS